jgi:hypothetical protein
MMTKTLLQQGQQCQLKDSNSSIMTMATIPLWVKGDNAILAMARMPEHQQRQQHHHHEGDNHNCNSSKDACALTATT